MLAFPETAPTIAEVQQEIDQARSRGPLREITVPPCPELLVRLQRAMASAEPDLTEISRIASADVAMAATLMRNANGALHAVGPPVNSVGQAMNRIGVRQTAAILTGFLARHAIPVHHPLLQRFWELSTRRAITMAFIAGELPGLSADLAYTFGLFCHVGMPVLMQSVRGYAGTITEARARIDRTFIETENANHRTDHTVVGALTARVWRLPAPVMTAIRLHHDLGRFGNDPADAEVHSLVAALVTADILLSRHEGLPLPSGWERDLAMALTWLQVAQDDLLHWEDRLRPVLDAA